MSEVLARWNRLGSKEAAEDILPCCGSQAWARGVAGRRPIRDEAALLHASDDVWGKLSEWDWTEAFRSHPRIGESHWSASTRAQSAAWSSEEQKHVSLADEEIRMALAEGNRAYEERFGRIFIVCASGKTPSEMLVILRRRLHNDESTELHEAAEQQRQITQIRLRKWLQP